MKRALSFTAILTLSILSAGCTPEMPGVEKLSGTGLARSEYFKAYDKMDQREHVTYYKPFSLDDRELPQPVVDAVRGFDSRRLPFTADEEKAFLVTAEEGTNEVQVSYLGKDEYGQTEEFFIISVADIDQNPLASYELADEFDEVGNRMTREQLTGDIPIYQQLRTTDSALLYTYYEEDEKGIATVGTAANELYAYYGGHIYHIGYSFDRDHGEEVREGMLEMAREYILSREFTED